MDGCLPYAAHGIVNAIPAHFRNCPPSRRNSVHVALESASALIWKHCPPSAGIRRSDGMPHKSTTATSCNSALTESRILAVLPYRETKRKGRAFQRTHSPGLKSSRTAERSFSTTADSFLLDVATNYYCATGSCHRFVKYFMSHRNRGGRGAASANRQSSQSLALYSASGID